MLKWIKTIYKKYKIIFNYVFFGVLAAIVNLVVKYILLFTVLNPQNGFHLQIAVVISWIVAVVFAYFTNRIYVFNSENKRKFKEFISFVAGRLATLLIEMFVMWFFITLLKLNSDLDVVIFTLIAQVLVVIGNYFVSKFLVFKK